MFTYKFKHMSAIVKETRGNQNSRIGKQFPVREFLNNVSNNAYVPSHYCSHKPLINDSYHSNEDGEQQPKESSGYSDQTL